MLQIEIGQYRNLVFGRVVAMPDRWRGKGHLAAVAKSNGRMALRSETGPSLEAECLYVWGKAGEADGDVFVRHYPTIKAARGAVALITEAVTAANEPLLVGTDPLLATLNMTPHVTRMTYESGDESTPADR